MIKMNGESVLDEIVTIIKKGGALACTFLGCGALFLILALTIGNEKSRVWLFALAAIFAILFVGACFIFTQQIACIYPEYVQEKNQNQHRHRSRWSRRARCRNCGTLMD